MKIENRKSKIQNSRSAFTLIELLMVIVVIAILVGLLLPVLVPTRENAKRKKRNLDIRTLASAIKSYQHEYMKWPNPDASGADGIYSNTNIEVVNILTGEGLPDQPIRFLDPSSIGRDESGSLWCPDRRYYVVDIKTANKVQRVYVYRQGAKSSERKTVDQY